MKPAKAAARTGTAVDWANAEAVVDVGLAAAVFADALWVGVSTEPVRVVVLDKPEMLTPVPGLGLSVDVTP